MIDETAAAKALADLDDPPVGSGVVDPVELARQLAGEIGRLFGPRLVDVVLFGSYASGSATDDSDLDLVVVLRDVKSPFEDGRLMDGLLWEKTRESGITLSALVVDSEEWERRATPVLLTARASGQSVA